MLLGVTGAAGAPGTTAGVTPLGGVLPGWAPAGGVDGAPVGAGTTGAAGVTGGLGVDNGAFGEAGLSSKIAAHDLVAGCPDGGLDCWVVPDGVPSLIFVRSFC